jgi:peptidoglycan/xylan/chitin deacetylase (PgdA/CDA1 family)
VPLSPVLAQSRGHEVGLARRARRKIRAAATGPMHHLRLWTLYRAFRRTILRKREICCLMLHRVLTEDDYQLSNSFRGITVRERTFAGLLEYLANSFQVLSVSALLDGHVGDAGSSKPSCLITFDDGWVDNYTTAFPLLRRYRLPATIFLVTDLVENGTRFWVERVNEAWKDSQRRQPIRDCVLGTAQGVEGGAGLLEVVEYLKHLSAEQRESLLDTFLGGSDKPPHDVDRMMTWDQAAEMSRSGIEFGGHTKSHPLLTFESDDRVSRELLQSKQMIESQLGAPARAFAYPNGDWNDRVRKKVQEAGYECAFSVSTGWHCLEDDLFAIRRVGIHDGNVTNRRGEFSPAVFNWTVGRS